MILEEFLKFFKSFWGIIILHVFFNFLIIYGGGDNTLIAFRKGQLNEEAYTITV